MARTTAAPFRTLIPRGGAASLLALLAAAWAATASEAAPPQVDPRQLGFDPAALEEHARNLQAAANAEIKRLCQGESPLRHRAIADRVVETLIGPNWDVISRTTFGGYPEIALTGYHG